MASPQPTGSPQNEDTVFSIRIVSIDYYMTPPIPDYDICYSSFHGGVVEKVPVIRIYGSTLAGQKTCLHVHRALPYLYVPCSDIGLQITGRGEGYLRDVFLAVEKALSGKSFLGSKKQHVHGCSFVRAKRLYGYHSSEELFVKIYLYYPNDVSRASALLLGCAVLDRVIQPYESHVPFLLQFLIDNNLYGMSHVHAARIKFRQPLPNNVRSGFYSKQSMHVEKFPCSPTSFQADSSSGKVQSSAIWLSSTVPGEWTWADSSTENDGLLIKRQSTCELEVDSCVDDILNQISKIYTSLSQSRPDMKMVQSLVPIWNEEYKRSGIEEKVSLFKDKKPPPESVMESFLDRVQYDIAFSRFLSEIETPFSAMVSSPIVEAIGDANSSLNATSSVLHTDEALTLSGESLPKTDDTRMFLQGENIINNLRSISKRASLANTTKVVDPMVSDTEGARLLNWLASSQAVDEINSDDELGCEVILSPLFPTKSHDKLLEKAQLDYETISQRECQDILDTIEDTKVENFNHGKALFSGSEYVSCDSVIPQLDGSCDGEVESPMGKECETNITSKSAVDDSRDGRNNLKKNVDQYKRSTFMWGPLQLSSKKKELEDIGSSSGKSSEAVINEMMHEKDTGLLVNEAVKDCDTSKINMGIYISPSEVGNKLNERSLRDMMRKKRLQHADVVECKISQVQGACIMERGLCQGQQSELGNIKCHIDQEDENKAENSLLLVDDSGCTRHSMIYSEELKSHSLQSSRENAICKPLVKTSIDEKLQCRLLSCSSHLSACVKCSSLPGQQCLIKDSQSGVVSDILDDAGLSIQQSNIDCFSGGLLTEGYTCKEKTKVDSSNIPYTFHVDVNRTKCQSESYEMVFSRKPPTAEQVKDFADIICAASNAEGPCDSISLLTSSFLKNERKDIPSSPFFMREIEDTGFSNETFNQEVTGGVPVHFQNDGSLLYLLTFAVSPPSLEHVSKWLSGPTEQDYPSGNSHLAWFEKPPKIASLGNVNEVDCGISKVEDSGHIIDSQVPVMANVNRTSPQSVNICDPVAVLAHSDIVKGKRSIKKNSASDIVNIAIEQLATVSEGFEPNNYLQDASQISGPDRKAELTPLSQIGFRDPASMGNGQQLTLLSIEILAHSRGELRPDPQHDAVNVVTLVIQEDCSFDPEVYVLLHSFDMEQSWRDADRVFGCMYVICPDERSMFQHLMKIISSMDPDILMGWETQGSSLGFLAERAAQIGIHFLRNISRTPASCDAKTLVDNEKKDQVTHSVIAEDSLFEDEWGRTHASGFHIGGRIVLNLWRLMRAEVKLNMYSVEAVAEEVLRIKVPYIPSSVLNGWFTSSEQRARFQCIGYIIEKAKLNLTIVNQLDMINRTSELARVFGIDFFSVLSRGSQYRVESMLLRLAHTQNYLAISPGSQQVALQPAMECLPLVMEPVSGFYADPVVVLDFQSLYPSMIIAYNLCYSTCLGKLTSLEENILGVSSYSPDRQLLRNLNHQILLSPNGVMYVPRKVRQGVLPRLLEEILTTRIMVKQKMKKLDSSKRVMHRIYNARQLALKLIANVSYGYTAAGFSGRMPCAELADSIVQCGRRTLETAISFVNANSRWNATVVYGDTDSMFVYLKGRNLEEAFKIGNEIATAITAMNPNPVTLKLEKVYHPCFLLTKKRYVGYSYESPGQKTPIFDAKGIETVRRDTCPAVAKILERSLRMFFEHQDITMIKSYLQRQWTRILRGKYSLQDFIFAKEVRLGTYCANASSFPPAAIVATKRMRSDPRSEPLYAERVPYVVVYGEPGARLADMVVDPLEILDIGSPYRLNDTYYINKQIIPALQRIFGLLGVEMKEWYSDIHRPSRSAFSKCYSYGPSSGSAHEAHSNKQIMSRKHAKRSRIDSYYLSKHCCLCGGVAESSAYVCNDCSTNEAVVAAIIIGKTSKLEREMQHLSAICGHCGGADRVIESGVKCTSLACSVFYERRKVQKELLILSTVASEAGLYPRCMVEWF